MKLFFLSKNISQREKISPATVEMTPDRAGDGDN
jgi:hypothetical protein